jgi:hypothetical protein
MFFGRNFSGFELHIHWARSFNRCLQRLGSSTQVCPWSCLVPRAVAHARYLQCHTAHSIDRFKLFLISIYVIALVSLDNEPIQVIQVLQLDFNFNIGLLPIMRLKLEKSVNLNTSASMSSMIQTSRHACFPISHIFLKGKYRNVHTEVRVHSGGLRRHSYLFENCRLCHHRSRWLFFK